MLRSIRHPVTSATLLTLVLAALNTAVPAEHLARAQTPALSWDDAAASVQLQNAAPSRDMNVTVTFHDGPESNRVVHQIERRDIKPGAATTLYWPALLPTVPEAFTGSVVNADQPAAAIAQSVWLGRAAEIRTNSPFDDDIILPLALNDVDGLTTVVELAVYEHPVEATLSFYAMGESEPAAEAVVTVPPWHHQTQPALLVDIGEHPAFRDVPRGTAGWIRVRAAENLVAGAYIRSTTGPPAVASLVGTRTTGGMARLYLPLMRHDHFGTTRMAIVNPAEREAQVAITYRVSLGEVGPCADSTRSAGPPVTVPAGTGIIVAPSDLHPYSGNPIMPAGCYGTATVENTLGTPIIAAALDVDADASGTVRNLSAYRSVDANLAGEAIALPLVRFYHTDARLATGIQVMNVGASSRVPPASVRVWFYDEAGDLIPGDDRTATIRWRREHTWFAPSMAGVSDRHGRYGSAIVTGDQPLAVVVNEWSMNGRMDASSHIGVRIDPEGW